MIIGIYVQKAQRSDDVTGAVFAYTDTELSDSYCDAFACEAISVNDKIRDIVEVTIQQFYKKVGKPVENIVAYVEGFDSLIKKKEKDNALIQTVLLDVVRKYNPAADVCVLNVHKRVSARFFSANSDTKSNSAYPYTNCPVGTVIDASSVTPLVPQKPDTMPTSMSEMTHEQSFFLIASEANQGCANPVKYTVLRMHKEVKFKGLQMLSFQLCHLYYNWTGTIRIPAPLMYATKMTKFFAEVLQKQTVNSNLLTNKSYL
jgi:aubergine-like protein